MWRRGVELLRLRSAEAAPPWRWSAAASYHRTIQAVPREQSGSHAAARERANGRIPAVVLSLPAGGGYRDAAKPGMKQLLTVDAKQIREILKKTPFFFSTRVRLQVRAGERSDAVLNSGKVLLIKVHKHSETGKILNLVMAWAEDGTELAVDVPVEYKGEDASPGLRKGGYLQKIRTQLTYLCPAEHIPAKIEVDLADLDIGDKVLMSDLDVHLSLKLLSKNSVMPVCKILASKPAEPEEAHQTSKQPSMPETV